MPETEWKVSDTGSAHWASSYNSNSLSSLLISFAKCIPHFFIFFFKNCLFNIVSFYHPFWIIWLFLLHISKRFFPFIEENGTLWLTKNRSTNGFYCLGVMALEIQENNSQHFYGIYIYVTCRTSPISRDPFITIKMYSKCKIKCVNLQFNSQAKNIHYRSRHLR